MHRIDHATAAPGNLFTEGSPSPPVPATAVTDDWLNDMQENVCDVVEEAGIALVKGDYTQLRQAIQAMLIAAQKAVVINGATFEASVANGEVVRWDSANSRFDEAVADGTANNRAVGVADVTNSKVTLYGECALFTGLTPGARYYLDASTPGAITATAPADAVMVGIAKSATVLWVDVDAQASTNESVAIQGTFKNLAISAGGVAASVAVSCDELVLGDGSGGYAVERGIAGTITTTTTGAGGLDTGVIAGSTWYSIWRIGKTDGTRAFLFSLSATAPTMPADYTLRARIGWFRTDGTANKYPLAFQQMGRSAQYLIAAGTNVTALPSMASGAAGSTGTPTWVAISVGNFVPPTAARIRGVGSCSGNVTWMIAPHNTYGPLQSATNPPPLSYMSPSGLPMSMQFDFLLQTTNIYWAASGSSLVQCMGWEDNI